MRDKKLTKVTLKFKLFYFIPQYKRSQNILVKFVGSHLRKGRGPLI